MRDKWVAHRAAGAYLAEFNDATALRHAADELKRLGYTQVETYSPLPVASEKSRTRSVLPVTAFVVGVLGALVSYGIQWWANVYSYPRNIGGRPQHAIPGFIIPTFEGTVLSAALAVFVGCFVVLRWPQLWHPVFEIPGFDRATVDRFWVAIDGRDPRAAPDVTAHELADLKPLRVIQWPAA